MTNIQPYRKPGEIIKPVGTYGLLRAPKPPKLPPLPKPHECSPPGFFHRIGLFLIDKPVREGSLFRCKECGLVSKFCVIDFVTGYWGRPSYVLHTEWKELGGDIEED